VPPAHTLIFPNFDPILVHVGPFAIRWYALAYVAGILLGWRYAAGLLKTPRLWTHRPPPLSVEQLDDLILWIALGVIGGGRIGHTLFYDPQIIWRKPLEILMVWHGGMSFHGGVIGVTIAMLIFAWKNKLDLLRIADVVAAAYPIGHFLGRIANFINGELWGRPTTVPWGMVFCNEQIRKSFGYCPAGIVPRHPSQLYEAFFEGLVLFAILRWATHKATLTNRRGVVTGLFVMFYGIFRIALENVRMPDEGMPDFPFGLTMGMILSVPMVIGGGYLIWRGMREPLPPALPAPVEAIPAEPAPKSA
jgi:phosphatidylglycerol:prolipoprotein diacylglycerol transferase